MIGNEIEKRNQFREQSVPILSQIEEQEIETAHKSVVSPCFHHVFPQHGLYFRPELVEVNLTRDIGSRSLGGLWRSVEFLMYLAAVFRSTWHSFEQREIE